MASLELQDRKLEEYEMQLFNFHSRSVYATCKAPPFWVSLECFSDFMAFLLCTIIYSNRWTGALWYHVDLLMTRVTLVHCLEYFHQPYGRSWSQSDYASLLFSSHLISSVLFFSLTFLSQIPTNKIWFWINICIKFLLHFFLLFLCIFLSFKYLN